MESSDSLTTFAELAIALAGFTGLLTAFQRKQIVSSDQQRFRIRMLLLVCFAIMAFALTPKTFVNSTASADWMWRLPTIGWSLFAIFVCTSFVRRIVVGSVRLAMPKSTWSLLVSGLPIHVTTLAGSGLLLWEPGFAALAVGVIWGLLFGGMFFYATLAIVWKQEDAR